MVLISPPTIIPNALHTPGDIHRTRPPERLAVVQRLEGGQLRRVALHEVRELHEHLSARVAGGVEAPDGVEGLLGGFDGEVNVGGGADGDGGDGFAVCCEENVGSEKDCLNWFRETYLG